MKTLNLDTRLSFAKLQYDKDNEAHLVVTLTAPAVDWQAKRLPICIIPCIDISGSMGGPKLDYAKQSVLKLIDHLRPGDYCGLVTFESAVQVVKAPCEMTQHQKDQLKSAVERLHVKGSTNFSGGMCEGLDLLNKSDVPDGMLYRIIMFTDGQANAGVATKREELVPLLESKLGRGTMSAFGYGTDADQDLLADLAQKGKGNYAFVRNPDDALGAFAKELGGLLSTYAQDLEVVIAPHNGHVVLETLSDVDASMDGTKVKVKLADLLAEEERNLVFKVKLDKQANAFPRQSTVFDVTVTYAALDEGKKLQAQTLEGKAKVQFVKDGEQDTKPDASVDRIVALAQLVAAQVQAEEQAKRGNYAGAQQILRGVGADYQSRGLDDLNAAALNVAGKMADHGTYANSTGYLNSTKRGFTRSVGVSSMDDEAAQLIASAGIKVGTKAQVDMQTNWKPATPAAPAPAVLNAVPQVQVVNVQVGVGVQGVGAAGTPVVPATPDASKRRSKRW